MAWETEENATQLTAFSVATAFDLTPTLQPGELAHCQVTLDFGASAVAALVSVQTTLDDASEIWDSRPVMVFRKQNTVDPLTFSFVVTGFYKFRVFVEGRDISNVAALMTSADLSIRRDSVDLST